jgi:hypothetical protein
MHKWRARLWLPSRRRCSHAKAPASAIVLANAKQQSLGRILGRFYVVDRRHRRLPRCTFGPRRQRGSGGRVCPIAVATRRRARPPLNHGWSSPSASAARCCSSSFSTLDRGRPGDRNAGNSIVTTEIGDRSIAYRSASLAADARSAEIAYKRQRRTLLPGPRGNRPLGCDARLTAHALHGARGWQSPAA